MQPKLKGSANKGHSLSACNTQNSRQVKKCWVYLHQKERECVQDLGLCNAWVPHGCIFAPQLKREMKLHTFHFLLYRTLLTRSPPWSLKYGKLGEWKLKSVGTYCYGDEKSGMGLTVLKSRYRQNCVPFQHSRVDFISFPFQVSQAACIPWLVNPFHLQNQQCLAETFSHFISLTLIPKLPLFHQWGSLW